jgi:hypothetical protein
MAGLSLGDLGNLPDFLRQQAALYRQRCARAQRARRKSPRTALPAQGGRVALADGLTFRMMTRSAQSGTFTPESSRPPQQAEAIAEKFRLVFLDVWQQVPPRDRQRLLAYWRDQPDRNAWGDRYAPRYATVRILLLDGIDWSGSSSTCEKLGNELIFPTSLVALDGDRLPHAVARTLALVLRHATRRHWVLIVAKIEGPLERWLKRRGKNADEANREAKLDRLEVDYLAAYEAEIAGILRGWGFDPRAPGADQPGRESDGV